MTPTQRALKIVLDNVAERMTASEFAVLMWPDSPCWRRVTRCGRGSHAGKGMWLAAGSFLRKLEKRGLIYRCDNHSRLTEAGKVMLKDVE